MKELFLAASLATAALAGCDNPSGEVPEESGPLGIVAPVYDLSPQPLVRSGGAPDNPFYRVASAALLEDGFAVADASHSISVLDSEGNTVRRLGRQGEGPGEFRRIRKIQRLADGGIAAWDPIARRVTSFDPDGEVRSVVGLRPPSGWSRGWRAEMVGSLANGDLVFLDFLDASVAAAGATINGELVRDTAATSVVNPASGVRTVLAKSPAAERLYRQEEGASGAEPILFSSQVFAVGLKDEVVTASNRRLDLSLTRVGGGGGYVVSFPAPLVAPSDSALEAERGRRLAEVDAYLQRDRGRAVISGGSHGSGRSLREIVGEFKRGLIEEAPAADYLPVIDTLLQGMDGDLWIKPRDSDNWVILDQTLAPVMRVELPHDAHVLDVSRDRVALLETDELGREFVSVHPILPGQP